MGQVKSMRELCSILNRTEDIAREIAIFLHLYGYDERPDIFDPNTELIRVGTSLDFNVSAAVEVLHKVGEEQKENGHLEVAGKAMDLCLRLSDLERDVMGKNTQ